MKRTSFKVYDDFDNVKQLVDKLLPSYTDDEIEIVEDSAGCTVYVKYDDTDVKIRELEECFMEVMMLENYLDAWNMIVEFSEIA